MMGSDINNFHLVADCLRQPVHGLTTAMHESTLHAPRLTRRPHSRTTRVMRGRTRSGTFPGNPTGGKP
eukprot:10274330-Lingulodinium_polyedra.AAC.1